MLSRNTFAFWRWHLGSLSHSDAAATQALKDERQFAEKLLAQADLSAAEREQIAARLRMVVRRAGNAELEAGHIEKAREHYKEANDRWSRYMLGTLGWSPFIARKVVTLKHVHIVMPNPASAKKLLFYTDGTYFSGAGEEFFHFGQ